MLLKLPFPLADLVGMKLIFGCQLGQGLAFLKASKATFALNLGLNFLLLFAICFQNLK
jgi:hypothetical protein